MEITTPKGENVDRDYDEKVSIKEKPFKWWLILIWIGGVLGGLLFLLGLIKLIGMLANRGPAPVVEEYYEGPYKARLQVTEGGLSNRGSFATVICCWEDFSKYPAQNISGKLI